MSVSIGYRASMPLSEGARPSSSQKGSSSVSHELSHPHPLPSDTNVSISPNNPFMAFFPLPPPLPKVLCVKKHTGRKLPVKRERDHIVIKVSRAGTKQTVCPVATTWTNLRLRRWRTIKGPALRSLMAIERAYSNLGLMNVRCSEHALFCILLLFVAE